MNVIANRHTPDETARPRRSREDDIEESPPLFQHSVRDHILLLPLIGEFVHICLEGYAATTAFVDPIDAPRCRNMSPHARVSTWQGVGMGKWPIESGKEIIPQPGVWDAKLKWGKQKLDDVELQAA